MWLKKTWKKKELWRGDKERAFNGRTLSLILFNFTKTKHRLLQNPTETKFESFGNFFAWFLGLGFLDGKGERGLLCVSGLWCCLGRSRFINNQLLVCTVPIDKNKKSIIQKIIFDYILWKKIRKIFFFKKTSYKK